MDALLLENLKKYKSKLQEKCMPVVMIDHTTMLLGPLNVGRSKT